MAAPYPGSSDPITLIAYGGEAPRGWCDERRA